MHKDEASKLFSILGDVYRVKIMKILYNNDEVSRESFYKIFSCSPYGLELHFIKLKEANLINVRIVDKDTTYFSCNKELLDELMNFFKTKCSCCNQVNGD